MATRTLERSDLEIQRDVLNELRWDPRLQPNDVAASVHDGFVTLVGWVDNYNKKWIAERPVRRVK